MVKFLYGVAGTNVDVTELCFEKLLTPDGVRIVIPANDHVRSGTFQQDPVVGVVKSIFIVLGSAREDEDGDGETIVEIDASTRAQFDTRTERIVVVKNRNSQEQGQEQEQDRDLWSKHATAISKLALRHGSFMEELPEQLMVLRFLAQSATVLEIGSNIGRNSLIIQSVLGPGREPRFVTLECDTATCDLLRENRDGNGMSFVVENAALSKQRLVQQGWNTTPLLAGERVPEGYVEVPTIDFRSLCARHGNVAFDTLVLDCEGAFFHILTEMPEILDTVVCVIMENDYHDFSQKLFVDEVLCSNAFEVVYCESGGWGPCIDCFYEVWRRIG